MFLHWTDKMGEWLGHTLLDTTTGLIYSYVERGKKLPEFTVRDVGEKGRTAGVVGDQARANWLKLAALAEERQDNQAVEFVKGALSGGDVSKSDKRPVSEVFKGWR